ncbi:MAG: secretion system protein F [Phototrophicales bacterium]|nr:MAG: secretion system protein F [Phototrophicales bacterium]RMG76073.1 MAG: secretion system protein F [Chloroflexota bacterium]
MTTEQILILGGAILAALVIIAIGILSARSEEDLIEERLSRATGNELEPFLGNIEETSDITTSGVGSERSALSFLDNILKERKFGKKWRTQLARADIKLTVAEFATLHFLGMIGGFALGYFVLFSGDMVFSIILGFMGFFAPRIYVARSISRRLIAFENQLPDTLSLWVNALRSGYSVLQSMEAVAKDAGEPTRTEFQRVVQEVQIGIDMSDALQHLLDRVESEDLDLVITAVNIQREVGGNLAEILDVIGTTIRERIKLKGEIRVLTSQGRITGYLISFLPIILAMLLNVLNPGYMGQMFENRACGWPMIGVGLAMIGIGAAIIQKIVDIEI